MGIKLIMKLYQKLLILQILQGIFKIACTNAKGISNSYIKRIETKINELDKSI